MGKQNLYEHTWKVPFIMMGPRIPKGSSASGFIYLSDVLPTFCDFAGIETPDSVDGKSFRDVVEGKQERIRDHVYGVYAGGTKPGMRSIKTADGWKLIEYNVLGKTVRETQMFNLNNNPNEFLPEHHDEKLQSKLGIKLDPLQTDLSEHPDYQEQKSLLTNLLLAEMQELGDPYDLEGVYEKDMPKRKNQQKRKPAGQSNPNGK